MGKTYDECCIFGFLHLTQVKPRILLLVLCPLVLLGTLSNAEYVSVEPSYIKVTVGGNVSLGCLYKTTNLIDSVEWYRQQDDKNSREKIFRKYPTLNYTVYGNLKTEQRITYYGDDHGNSTLAIERLGIADSGVYTCEVTIQTHGSPKYEIVRNSTTVQITALPSKPSIEQIPSSVYAKELFSLLCTANLGYPPAEITWYKIIPTDPILRSLGSGYAMTKTPLPNGEFEGTSELKASLETDESGAQFKCVVNNSVTHGGPLAVVTGTIVVMEIPLSFTTSKDWTRPSVPIIAIAPSDCDKPLTAGRKITLFCHVNLGQPQGYIVWEKMPAIEKPNTMHKNIEKFVQLSERSEPTQKTVSVVSMVTEILNGEDIRSTKYRCIVKQHSPVETVYFTDIALPTKGICETSVQSIVGTDVDNGGTIAAITLGSTMCLLSGIIVLFILIRLRQRNSVGGKYILDLPITRSRDLANQRNPPQEDNNQQVVQQLTEATSPPTRLPAQAVSSGEEHIYSEIQNAGQRHTVLLGASGNVKQQYEEPICCSRNCSGHPKHHEYFVLEEETNKTS